MYKRMLDKQHMPSPGEIEAHTGPEALRNAGALETWLGESYDLKKELRFPFGNQYGWGYKYAHKNKHLLYLFFEREAVTAMLQIGDAAAVEPLLPALSPYGLALWENRYPCGNRDGGWIHYRITESAQLPEIQALIQAKLPGR